MKTLPVIAFLAALAALVFSPVSLEIGGSILFAVGFLSLLSADYTRRTRVLDTRHAAVIGLPRAPRSAPAPAPAFELAA